MTKSEALLPVQYFESKCIFSLTCNSAISHNNETEKW